MSYTFFCHNIQLAPTCTAWEPSVSTFQMVTLRSEVRGSDFNSVVSQHAGLNGVIAVKDDMLFHNSPSSNTILSAGQLYFSSDFGVNWSTVTKPVDTNFQTVDSASFTSAYPNSFGWGPSFRVIGNTVHAMLRAGEDMSVWSTTDGSTWSMVTSTAYRTPGTAGYYAGYYLKVGSGAYQIGNIEGEPYIFGKWAWSTTQKYSCLQIGSWTPGSNPGMSEWYNTLDNNIVSIGDTGYASVAVGRRVYQWANAPGGGLQLIDLDAYSGGVKVATSYWNGVNSWVYTTTGSWLVSSGLNSPFASLSPAAASSQYSGDHEVASIPLTGNETSTSGNWGKWYIFTGSSSVTVDFSAEMRRETGVDLADSTAWCGALRYVPDLGVWILTWIYPPAVGQSTALNMRMCTRVGSTWTWSDKVRYLLPAGFLNTANKCQIEYSASQGKFVFGGHFSTPSPYLLVASFDNVFVCSLYGNPYDACVWTPPSSTITAELIWSEEDGDIPNNGFSGILGTDGAGRIIANPTGQKIIVSDDFGDTWTTYENSLPDSNFDPGNTWLRPTSWQYFSGKWRVALSEIDSSPSNAHAYAASFDAGTWTVGEWNDDRGAPPTYQQVGLRNGRNTTAAMYWDDNGVTVVGIWGINSNYPGTDIGAPSVTNTAAARYTSNLGNNSVPTDYHNIDDNDGAVKILPLSDGFFGYRWDGARMTGDWIAYDLNSSEPYGRTNGASAVSYKATGNGVDTVVLPRLYNTGYRWYRGVGVNLETFSTNTGASSGTPMCGYCPQHWLYANGPSATAALRTSYCEDAGASTFTQGPQVTLPNSVSSTSTDASNQNIFYAGSGVWVGYYIRATDRKVDIYRFNYGTLTGSCA